MGFPTLAEHKADADATHSHFYGKGLHYWGGGPDDYTMLDPDGPREGRRWHGNTWFSLLAPVPVGQPIPSWV